MVCRIWLPGNAGMSVFCKELSFGCPKGRKTHNQKTGTAGKPKFSWAMGERSWCPFNRPPADWNNFYPLLKIHYVKKHLL